MADINKLFTLIAQLAPIAASVTPKASEVAAIAAIVADLLAYIQQQSGMTTDQILDRAGTTLDENEKELLADLAQLQGGGATGGSAPGGGSAGGSSDSTPGGIPPMGN